MYSDPMRLAPKFIAPFFWVALLSLQLSGMHMHVSLAGGDGGLHGSHTTHDADPHHADPHGDDHSTDVDVSMVELNSVWSKLLSFLLPVAIMLLSLVWLHQPVRLAAPPSFQLKSRTRWRPPLRAPPLPA